MNRRTVHVIIIKRSKLLMYFSAIIFVFLFFFFVFEKNDSRDVFNSNTSEYNTTMKRDLLCLMVAYWPNTRGVYQTSDSKVYLVMQSGNKILYDDKKVKNADEKFNNADLQDMLEQIYPIYTKNYLKSIDYNPGRNRVYKLFEDVYGKSKEKIEGNLVAVGFGDLVLKFNNKNSAAASLKKINSELAALSRANKSMALFIYPSSGTYNYRYISGTNLLSSHSFGTAIDLAANDLDYWQWASRWDVQKRMSIYPAEVVKIFEKNNFIWGGRWGYFDLMHYEYRPELIIKAKYFSKSPEHSQPWYKGSPYLEDVHIRNYVRMIDEAIKQ